MHCVTPQALSLRLYVTVENHTQRVPACRKTHNFSAFLRNFRHYSHSIVPEGFGVRS